MALRTLAELYLMRALTVKRSRQKEIDECVAKGECILPGCCRKIRSRGLCDSHRQLWYTEYRGKDDQSQRDQFEANCISEGLILPSGEQPRIQRKQTSPFASAG